MSADDWTKIVHEVAWGAAGLMFLWWIFFHKEG